jgi:hypothetical protein
VTTLARNRFENDNLYPRRNKHWSLTSFPGVLFSKLGLVRVLAVP